MGACTPAGKAALVICWQWGHCFCSARYSRTTTRGDGRSTSLSPLSSTRWNRSQVVLASFTLFYLLLNDLIWRGRELQTRAWMPYLPSRWLLALCAQAEKLAHKTVRGRRQMAIVAILPEPFLQRFHLLCQGALLLSQLLYQGILLAIRNPCCCWMISSRSASWPVSAILTKRYDVPYTDVIPCNQIHEPNGSTRQLVLFTSGTCFTPCRWVICYGARQQASPLPLCRSDRGITYVLTT